MAGKAIQARRQSPVAHLPPPDDATALIGQRIAIHLAASQYESCREILEFAIAERTAPTKPTKFPKAPPELINVPLAELGISLRCLNFLEAGGYHTVGEVAQANPEELLEIENFGTGHLKEVREKLAAYLGVEAPAPNKAWENFAKQKYKQKWLERQSRVE